MFVHLLPPTIKQSQSEFSDKLRLYQNHFLIVLGPSHDFKYGLMPGPSSDFKYGLIPGTSNDYKYGLIPGASNDFKYGLLPESWPKQETWENGKY